MLIVRELFHHNLTLCAECFIRAYCSIYLNISHSELFHICFIRAYCSIYLNISHSELFQNFYKM